MMMTQSLEPGDWISLIGIIVGSIVVLLGGMAALIQKLVAADIRLIRKSIEKLENDIVSTNDKLESEARKRERLQSSFKELVGYLRGRKCFDGDGPSGPSALNSGCFEPLIDYRDGDSVDPVREAARLRRMRGDRDE